MKKTFALVALSVMLIPSAWAGPIIIPVRQNQTNINVGTVGQNAGGGTATQTGVLTQTNQPTQTVNVYVPENYKGNVRPVYLPGNGNLEERGRSFLHRRDGRGEEQRGPN